jgi:archaemetzincin
MEQPDKLKTPFRKDPVGSNMKHTSRRKQRGSTLKRLSSEQSHLDIIPLGQVNEKTISIMAANLQVIMGVNANILSPLPEPEDAYLPLRSQYSAGKILRMVESVEGARFKLGVVQCDICTPILRFVYGESQLGGVAAVVSLCRLGHMELDRMYMRAAKISLHEMAHLLGVGHCRTLGCLMDPSINLERLDALPLRFCSSCEYEIGRALKRVFPP